MIGRVFNNCHQITERIGIGGMAEVYRAQDNARVSLVAEGHAAAIRRRPELHAALHAGSRRCVKPPEPLTRERTIGARTRATAESSWEFAGSDLKTAIIERGAINQRKVAEIGAQVCQALSVAHGLDIIHRDIKPQNIMVQPDGNVKVMDFGIARAKNSVMTQTSSVLGTAHYISPEQAQGKDLTATSDIYRWASCCTSGHGRLPFDGPDAVSVAGEAGQRPARCRRAEINPDIDPVARGHHHEGHREEPGRTLRHREGHAPRAERLPGRTARQPGREGFTSAETVAWAAGSPVGGLMHGRHAHDGGVSRRHPPPPAQRSGNANNTSGKKNNKKTIAIVIGRIIAALAVVGGIDIRPESGGGDDKDKIVPSVAARR